MSLAGCQVNLIYVNFHLQKSLEIFDTNSADKIQSQNHKGGKSALPHANSLRSVPAFFLHNLCLQLVCNISSFLCSFWRHFWFPFFPLLHKTYIRRTKPFIIEFSEPIVKFAIFVKPRIHETFFVKKEIGLWALNL